MCDCTVVNKDAKINLMYNMSISEINFCRSTKFIYAKKVILNVPSFSLVYWSLFLAQTNML